MYLNESVINQLCQIKGQIDIITSIAEDNIDFIENPEVVYLTKNLLNEAINLLTIVDKETKPWKTKPGKS